MILTYDATGQQTRTVYTGAGGWDIQQAYDGDRQRVKKIEGGQTTFYLRSTVMGGQVVAEYNQTGEWRRGYVYDGTGQLLAMQAGEVQWVHQDPVTKSKRVTNRQGEFVAAIDVDPWGGETSKMYNGGVLSQKYTTYERDGNGRDQAMMRSYCTWFSRFDQPDPFDGSYDLTNPQTLNHYAYVNNDPVNFIDPSGLDEVPFVDGGTVTVTGTYYDYALHERALSGGRLAGGIRPRRLLPLDPRRRGGSEPPNPIDINEFKKDFYDFYKDDVNRCVKEVFGEKRAKKLGEQNLSNAPKLNVSKTSQQLSKLTGVKNVIGTVSGRNTILIAKEHFNDLSFNINELERTFAHELGNLLSYRLTGSDFTFGDKKGLGQSKDKDTGAKFELCIFGSLTN